MRLKPQSAQDLLEGNAVPLIRDMLALLTEAELMWLTDMFQCLPVNMVLSDSSYEILCGAEDRLNMLGWKQEVIDGGRLGRRSRWVYTGPEDL